LRGRKRSATFLAKPSAFWQNEAKENNRINDLVLSYRHFRRIPAEDRVRGEVASIAPGPASARPAATHRRRLRWPRGQKSPSLLFPVRVDAFPVRRNRFPGSEAEQGNSRRLFKSLGDLTPAAPKLS
jgi:hypothetical protein